MIKKFFYLLLAAFVIIQFFKPEKNMASQGLTTGNHLSTKYTVPADVEQILKTSCYDCHSNNTQYPWYANIQPVAWWLKDHIVEGKKEMNFDEFATYNLRKQYHKLEEVAEQIEHDEMPLSSYTLIHQSAKLDPGQKKTLTDWANATRKQMESIYPLDSLIRKKK